MSARRDRARAALLVAALLLARPFGAAAMQPPADAAALEPAEGKHAVVLPHDTREEIRHALIRLPLAALLGASLALRPKRRGTPPRQPAVIQTQIILAIVGAVVMLVVGTNLARAFGVVGAAGLVRYRAKIEDPKDAGVMLTTLAVGLASGVGLYVMAAFSAGFVLVTLWIVESFEPKAREMFLLKIKAKDPAALKPKVEQLFARNRTEFELRTASPEELHYEIALPIDRKTDRLSNIILALDPNNATAVEWEEKKKKE